jgi:hypothetical protein
MVCPVIWRAAGGSDRSAVFIEILQTTRIWLHRLLLLYSFEHAAPTELKSFYHLSFYKHGALPERIQFQTKRQKFLPVKALQSLIIQLKT